MGSAGRFSIQLLLHVLVVSLARCSLQETEASDCIPASVTDSANASFNGSSYAIISWRVESTSLFEMALNFSVRPVLNGSLFLMRAERPATTFFVGIRFSFPCFELVTGTTHPETVTPELCPARSLNGWYDVAVVATDSVVTVKLNELAESWRVDLNGQTSVSLRFGYLEESSGDVGFTGCMGDVRLNKTQLKLREDAVEQKDLTACSRDKDCHSRSFSVSGLSIRSTPIQSPAPPLFVIGVSSVSSKQLVTAHSSESSTISDILDRALPLYSSTAKKATSWIIASSMATVKDTTGISTSSSMVSVAAADITRTSTDITRTSSLSSTLSANYVRLHYMSSSEARTDGATPVDSTRFANVIKQIVTVRATPVVTAYLPIVKSSLLDSSSSAIIQPLGMSSGVSLSVGAFSAMGSSKMVEGSSLTVTSLRVSSSLSASSMKVSSLLSSSRVAITSRRVSMTPLPSLTIQFSRHLVVETSVVRVSSQSVQRTEAVSSNEIDPSVGSVLTSAVLTSTSVGVSKVSATSQAGVFSLSSAIPDVVHSLHVSSISRSLPLQESETLTHSLLDNVISQSKIAKMTTSEYVGVATFAPFSRFYGTSANGHASSDGMTSLDASSSNNMATPTATVGISRISNVVTTVLMHEPTTTAGHKQASDGDFSLAVSASIMPPSTTTATGETQTGDSVTLLDSSSFNIVPRPTATHDREISDVSSVSSSFDVHESETLTHSLTGSGHKRDSVISQSKFAKISVSDGKGVATTTVSRKYVDEATIALILHSHATSTTGHDSRDRVTSLDAFSSKNVGTSIATVETPRISNVVTAMPMQRLTTIVEHKQASGGDTSLDASTFDMPRPTTTAIVETQMTDSVTLLDSSSFDGMPRPTATLDRRKSDSIAPLDSSPSDDISRASTIVGSSHQIAALSSLRSRNSLSYLTSSSPQSLLHPVVAESVLYSDGFATFFPGSEFMQHTLEETNYLQYVQTVTTVSQRAAGTPTPTQVISTASALSTEATPVVVDISGTLMKLSHMHVTAEDALGLTMELELLTSDPEMLHAHDVEMTVDLLERITDTHPNDTKVGEHLLACVSNLMDVDDAVLLQSQTRSKSAVRVVKMLDNYALSVPVRDTDRVEIRQRGVKLLVVVPSDIPSAGIEFPNSVEESGSGDSAVSSVELSGDILASQHGFDRRWWFVWYNSSKLFQSTLAEDDVKGDIVGASVNSGPLRNLSEPVVLKFRKDRANVSLSSSSCVFWNFTGDEDGYWSTEGCQKRDNDSMPYVICECSHLTNFAVVLLPVNPTTIVGNTSQLSKLSDETKIIVIAGCGVAIVFLSFTLISLLCMRKLSAGQFGVYWNLCFCIIVCNILFVVSLYPDGTETACRVIGVMLHLFMLLSFAWLVAKSLNLCWTIFASPRHDGCVTKHRLKLMVVFCWGIPVLFIGLFGYYKFENYGSDSLCWLDDTYIWLIAGPIAGATGLSLIVWLVAIYGYNCRSEEIPQTRISENKSRLGRLIGTFFIACGLGTTWLLATFWLLWYREELILSYFVAGDNIITSLLIFVFYCLADSQVRNEYGQLFCCQKKMSVNMTSRAHNSTVFANESSSQARRVANWDPDQLQALDAAFQHEFMTSFDVPVPHGASHVLENSDASLSHINVRHSFAAEQEQPRSVTPDSAIAMTGQKSSWSIKTGSVLDSGIHENQVFEVPMPSSPGILKQVLSTEGLRGGSGSDDSMIMESRL